MKVTKFKQLLVLGPILFCQYAFGQLPSLDSLKLIPENPTAADEIRVICYATFASGSCDLDEQMVIVNGNQISLSLEYAPGAATYICHATDTVSLGNLNPGDYQLDAILMIKPMDAIRDYTLLQFTVENALGLNEKPTALDVTLHPNPFSSEIQIETNALIEKIEVSSISGQKINREIPYGITKTIDLSDLKDGIYLLTLIDQKGNRHSKRIVKNTL